MYCELFGLILPALPLAPHKSRYPYFRQLFTSQVRCSFLRDLIGDTTDEKKKEEIK